jgi:hypothetical protein
VSVVEPDDTPRDLWGAPVVYYAPKGRGAGSGQLSSVSEDWWTHPQVITLIHKLYDGPPDLDPMSCREANDTVKAIKFYTAEMNGLHYPWYGKMILNPPWGGGSNSIKRNAVRKLMNSYPDKVEACVCVLNANAVTTRWFAPLLNFPVCLPPHRIRHVAAGGEGGHPNSGTVIIYVGTDVAKFAAVFSGFGKIMVPYKKA